MSWHYDTQMLFPMDNCFHFTNGIWAPTPPHNGSQYQLEDSMNKSSARCPSALPDIPEALTLANKGQEPTTEGKACDRSHLWPCPGRGRVGGDKGRVTYTGSPGCLTRSQALPPRLNSKFTKKLLAALNIKFAKKLLTGISNNIRFV